MKAKFLVTPVVMMQLVAYPLQTVMAADLPPAEERYWSGYRVGQNDVRQHCQHQWNDPFISAGYRRGMREEQERVNNAKQAVTDNQPVANEQAAPVVDSRDDDDVQQVAALPLSMAQRQFINRLAPQAQQLGQQYDLYPSVLLAQAALESNWGQSGLAVAHHNLFGIKALLGQSAVSLPTSEDCQGGMRSTVAAFCHYQTEKEALTAYAQLLQAPVYQGVHRQRAQTYQQATRALTGVYATDHAYDQKLNHLIASYQLDRYDHQQHAVHQDNKTTQPGHHISSQLAAKPKTGVVNHSQEERAVPAKKLAWYWWPVSIISGGSFTWLIDFLRHRP